MTMKLVTNTYRSIKTLLLCALAGTHVLLPCMTTFFNDSNMPLLIIDMNDVANTTKSLPGKFISIPPNKSQRFGKSHELAHFTIYSKPQNHTFTAMYTVQQQECAQNGNPRLKFSDIKNNTGQSSLFIITPITNTYPSMVQELPSMQRPDI